MKRFFILGIVLVLITMAQNQALQKQTNKTKQNRPTILFYAFVHTANGLELIGAFRHAALLFLDLYYIYAVKGFYNNVAHLNRNKTDSPHHLALDLNKITRNQCIVKCIAHILCNCLV